MAKEKDPILKKEMLGFWIDEIYEIDKEKYGVRIIPDINSEYFPPQHLRNINISKSLLEKNFLQEELRQEDIFWGSVIQGEYYEISTRILKKERAFSNRSIITEKNNIFEGKIVAYKSKEEDNDLGTYKTRSIDEFDDRGQEQCGRYIGRVYLYCFNVGQGDSMLLITSNSNAYLIDMNISNKEKNRDFIDKVKNILEEHKINKIKGFIVTHKHIDHIRGADRFIDEIDIEIEKFFINKDYIHETKVVQRLFKAVNRKSVQIINVNRNGSIKDRDTVIEFKNPDKETATVEKSPDINDSSIVMSIKFRENLIHLTGDARHRILEKKLKKDEGEETLLKISHHGSRTGTNAEILSKINPKVAIISAGNNKKYNHPHNEVVNEINKRKITLDITKVAQRDICYEFDGVDISKI